MGQRSEKFLQGVIGKIVADISIPDINTHPRKAEKLAGEVREEINDALTGRYCQCYYPESCEEAYLAGKNAVGRLRKHLAQRIIDLAEYERNSDLILELERIRAAIFGGLNLKKTAALESWRSKKRTAR